MIRALIIGVLGLAASAAAADVRLTGRVLDENNAAVPGAQVTLRAAVGGDFHVQAAADQTGKFVLDALGPGDYVISVEREGYFRLADLPLALNEGANEITLVLNPAREVFEKVDVAYSPPAIDMDRTTSEERLTGTQLLEIPYPSTNTLRNAMRAMPGVVQDSMGGIHLNGGAEEQILYTLDGFEVNDPLTGRFDTRLSVESVRAMETTPLNPAEIGKGATGALAIKTSTGDDRFRYSGTNFIPGLENRKGLVIGGWTPRFNFSGPLRRSRAWFSDSVDVQYDKHIVEELPKGQDRTTSIRLSNLLRNQFNLTPSNILYTGFLTSFWTAPRNGLGALDPLPTTIDRRSRQWFFNIKDQWSFSRSALVELGYASNRTYGREIPQGHDFLVITPDGRRGNSFWDSTRTGARDEFLANVFLPSFTFLGGHQLKAGVDVDSTEYRQDIRRTGFETLRVDESVLRRVTFGGSGRLRLSDSAAATYLQDSWKPRASLLVEAGIRQDWDRILGNVVFSPRLGVSWAPPHLESTKVSAGYGIVYEQTNLQIFSQPHDQYSITTTYLPGGAIAGGPSVTVFMAGPGRLDTPRYRNWSVGVEHRIRTGIYARAVYTGRRGSDGFTYVNSLHPQAPPAPEIMAAYGSTDFNAIYRLRNWRRDIYDSVEATVRQTFRKQYEWMASYTRSRALSNAVVDIGVDNPLVVIDNFGRMPWDSPNRVLSWGYLPTFRENWAVAYLMEARDGFPFSIQDEAGGLLGPVNARRFPFFFELNLHLERRFVFHANRWAFRFGFNNITNHRNYNVVNNDIASPHFLTFYGGQSRAFVLRIRWLGKS